MLAHPADLFGWDADHQGVGFDIAVDDSTGGDECIFTDGCAADNGGVGTYGCAALNQGIAVFVFAADGRARVVHVGEDHAGAAEHIVFKGDVVIDGDIVLYLAVVADGHAVADKDILAQGAIAANFGAAADVYPLPDAATFTNLGALINDGCGVNGYAHGVCLVVQRQCNTLAVAGREVHGN